MPYGLKRFQQAESLYFITFSCYPPSALPILPRTQRPSPNESSSKPEPVTMPASFHCEGGYVLMPEHLHFLINEPPGFHPPDLE